MKLVVLFTEFCCDTDGKNFMRSYFSIEVRSASGRPYFITTPRHGYSELGPFWPEVTGFLLLMLIHVNAWKTNAKMSFILSLGFLNSQIHYHNYHPMTLSFGCLHLSTGSRHLSIGCLYCIALLSIGCLHWSFGCPHLSIGCLYCVALLSIGCLHWSFGCLLLSIGCLYCIALLSFGCLHLSIGCQQLHWGIQLTQCAKNDCKRLWKTIEASLLGDRL